MMPQRKGIAEIAFFLLIGLLVIASVWLFFIFFKVNVTSIGVDVNNVNRYQEVPTTLLGSSIEAKTAAEKAGTAKDIKDVNCFVGNGPAGSHIPNTKFCSKVLPFYYSKYANSVGDAMLSTGSDTESLAKEDKVLTEMKDVIRASLPYTCYRIIFRGVKANSGTAVQEDSLVPDNTKDDTNYKNCMDNLKLDAIYPMPIFFGTAPMVANQVLQIGSTGTNNDQLLITWPKYSTVFKFGGG